MEKYNGFRPFFQLKKASVPLKTAEKMLYYGIIDRIIYCKINTGGFQAAPICQERFEKMANAKLNDALLMEVKNDGACRREFTFKLPADAVKNETNRVLSYVASMVQLPGFRAGKAPLNLVRTKYADELQNELRSRLVSAAIEKLEADKSADILNVSFKKDPEIADGKEVEFVLNVDVAPEIDLGDYKSIKLDIPAEAVSDEKLNERIDMYRSMWGGYADSAEPAKADDMLKVSYKSDFTPAEDADASVKRQAAAEDTFLWLSEPEMIPGCIKALTGAEKGKEYDFTADYPENYRDAALAGKKVNYHVTVSAVQTRAKLSDAELIERVKAPSMEEFRKTLKAALEQENNGKRLEAAQEAFFNKLDESAGKFELPPTLLDNETAKELQKLMRDVRTDEDAEKFKAAIEDHKKNARANAEKSLRKTLILRQLAKAEKITVSDEEVAYQLESMSRYYGYKLQDMRAMIEKNGAAEELRQDLLNSKALFQVAEAALK